MARIAIAGAGLLGRLLAWRLGHAGHQVQVFDPAPGPGPAYDGHGAAAFSAAGMLCPTAELDRADARIADLGWRSIPLWRGVVDALQAPGLLVERGSLLLAHRADRGSAERALARLAGGPRAPQALDAAGLSALEPSLQGAAHAWLLPGEAQIEPPATLALLHARAAETVRWHWGATVSQVSPGGVTVSRSVAAVRVDPVEGQAPPIARHEPVEGSGAHRHRLAFDCVFDTRGLGARTPVDPTALHNLRGVRGETIWLQAPAHGLTRPVRLLHPRHAVYLLPRGPDRVFVGASEIESEDRSPVSLRSAVELMAAAHSVMPGLAEARIERLDRNLRPALPDHQPRIDAREGLVRINGLFRHGWLMAPALVQDALQAAGLHDLHDLHGTTDRTSEEPHHA